MPCAGPGRPDRPAGKAVHSSHRGRHILQRSGALHAGAHPLHRPHIRKELADIHRGAPFAQATHQEGTHRHTPGRTHFVFIVSLPYMETTRQNRISRLIQKDLGEILQMAGRDWFPGSMITVTKVYVTSDLSIAKAYLSIFGKDAGEVLSQVEMKNKEIRRQLGLRVKNQLRQVPALRFFIDDSLDYIDNIDKLLNQ